MYTHKNVYNDTYTKMIYVSGTCIYMLPSWHFQVSLKRQTRPFHKVDECLHLPVCFVLCVCVYMSMCISCCAYVYAYIPCMLRYI